MVFYADSDADAWVDALEAVFLAVVDLVDAWADASNAIDALGTTDASNVDAAHKAAYQASAAYCSG
ncbi:MAG: hypothetical protein F4044_10015 [Rhodobacteraceae bacterium]|nr:hypothetical protein [Paracoccaceae bacterium]